MLLLNHLQRSSGLVSQVHAPEITSNMDCIFLVGFERFHEALLKYYKWDYQDWQEYKYTSSSVLYYFRIPNVSLIISKLIDSNKFSSKKVLPTYPICKEGARKC